MLKTRRRKGLGDQIAVSKYLDDEFVVSNDYCCAMMSMDSNCGVYDSSRYQHQDMQTCSGKACVVVLCALYLVY